ncbi:MAG: hypothetical protein A2289_15320 [Deltaproteobacteria bacterium RIFOXYA12_FULL_58_15]|nr:MAG: hypothetical protein A2289_15320 [Deltaproteobacteria bacterium RIFOXYA12_FULL_58_15]
MRHLIHVLLTILQSLFGSLRWSPPTWLRHIGRGFLRIRAAVATFFGQHRRIAVTLLVMVGFGTMVGCWLMSRTAKPIEVSVSVNTPEPPPPRKETDPEPLPQPLVATFAGSVVPLEAIGKPVVADVSIDPPIAGEWLWSAEDTLTFTPKTHWPVGEEYEIKFDKKAIAAHIRLTTYELEMTTAPLDVTLSDAELYIDPKDPKIKKAVATFRFNYPVDTESFAKQVKMTLVDPFAPEKKLTFTTSFDGLGFEAYVHSENIEIPLEDQNLKVELEQGVRAASGGPKSKSESIRTIRIPGRYNLLKVASINVSLARDEQDQPEQVLVLETTVGVLEKTMAKAIEVLLLPKDKPAEAGVNNNDSANKDYNWQDASQIGADIIAASERVKLTQLPTAQEYATVHSFKLDVPPRRYVWLRVPKGLESHGGYLLANNYETTAQVPSFPREVRVMHEGAVLSQSGERRLSIMARGVGAVRIELARVMPQELNHLISQTYGDFRSPQFHNYEFNEDNIAEVFTEIRTLDATDPKRAQYTTVDFGPHVKAAGGIHRGMFFLKVEAWDAKENRAADLDDDEGSWRDMNQQNDRRFVLVTDLGVLVKDDALQRHEVYVQSLQSGSPVDGATVEIWGKNGMPVLTERTDASGRANFPSVKDFKREKEPVAYVVRYGSDLSFLPFQRDDRLLSFSRFDVSGVRTGGDGGKLSAFLFSDRGIYRPGDTFFVGAVIKPLDWQRPVVGVPIQMTVTDARGMQIAKQRFKLPESGFIEIRHATEDTSPTGTYTVRAYIVEDERDEIFLGSTTVRVEEFLPDKLRINASIDGATQNGWLKPDGLKAHVDLQNLFGTPAISHRVTASLDLSPSYYNFPGYRDFVFHDPQRSKESFHDDIDERITNKDGIAEFDLDLSRFATATYQLNFYAEGFELDGGRGVAAQASVMVSPLDYLIGIKSEGDLSYIKRGSKLGVDVIAIGSDLEKRSVEGLSAVIVEQQWVSVLTKQSNGTYKYQSVLKEVTRETQPLSIAGKGMVYSLPTDEPGTFVLSIRDATDTELNRVSFVVAGAANLTRQLERNAELQVNLDKRDYAAGDTIEIQIVAPYTGSGLITIERDRVYAHKWFKTTTTTSVQTIILPAGIEANSYVNVAFVRAADSHEIFMSPLSYGIAPFTVSRSQRIVAIDLEVPERQRPGEQLSINFKTDRSAKIVIFGVDEGILQVARYETPDPLGFFLSKRALEVSTRQILDLILPELSLVQQVIKTGGSDEDGGEGKNLNPFKRKRELPVAFWSGVIDASEQKRTFNYSVPDYFNGTIRIMAVAVAPDALGAKASKTFVRGPFVLNPGTPLFVSPGDQFVATVSVANNVEGSGPHAMVDVGLEVSEALELGGDRVQKIEIPEGHQKSARFSVKAKDVMGSASLTFSAKGGGESGKYAATTSVRPATPLVVTVEAGSVTDSNVDIPIQRILYPDLRKLEVGVSPLPLSLARGLAVYVEQFPYRCTEQLVSAAMPALILHDEPGFGYDKSKARAAVAAAVNILRGRQNSEGAFGFWAANSYVSDFQAVYAAHFLTEAKERGFTVPKEMLASALEYLQGLSRVNLSSLSAARLRAYAIYVLARNGKLATNEFAELHRTLPERFAKTWTKDVAVVYIAATYDVMRDAEQAKKVIQKAEIAAEVVLDADTFYDAQSYLGQFLYIVARHFPNRLEQVEAPLIKRLVESIQADHYTTLSSAYSILGLDAYAKAARNAPEMLGKVSIEEKDAAGKIRSIVAGPGLYPIATFSENAKSLHIASDSELPLFYSVTIAGFDRGILKEPLKANLEIIHTYLDASGSEVSEVAIGDEVTASIKIRTTNNSQLQNAAVVDLLPAGFDVVTGRGEQGSDIWGRIAAAGTTWTPSYADVREDRVVLYGTIGPEVSQFTYKIKAVSRGQFVVPPSFAEGMYDRTFQARSLAASMTVLGD